MRGLKTINACTPRNNGNMEGYKYLKFGNILLNEAVKSCVAVCIVGE